MAFLKCEMNMRHDGERDRAASRTDPAPETAASRTSPSREGDKGMMMVARRALGTLTGSRGDAETAEKPGGNTLKEGLHGVVDNLEPSASPRLRVNHGRLPLGLDMSVQEGRPAHVSPSLPRRAVSRPMRPGFSRAESS